MIHDSIPRVLYEHPVVEYIPLMVTDIWTGPVPEAVRSGRPYPSLRVLNSEAAWQEIVAAYAFAFPPLHSLPPLDTPLEVRLDLTLLALGFRVAAGIYRDRKVNLAASGVGPVCHLFTVPRVFFYKPVIDFFAFDRDGARLAALRGVAVGSRPQRPERSRP